MKYQDPDPESYGSSMEESSNHEISEQTNFLKKYFSDMGSKIIRQESLCRKSQRQVEAAQELVDEEDKSIMEECGESINVQSFEAQSSSVSSILTTKTPENTLNISSIGLLQGKFSREDCTEDYIFASSRETNVQIEDSLSSSYEIYSNEPLNTNIRPPDLSFIWPELKKQKMGRVNPLIFNTEKKVSGKRRKYKSSDSDDPNLLKRNRGLSLDEKRMFSEMYEQLALVDLIRAHQSTDQGCFRNAPIPLSPPLSLDLPTYFATQYPVLYKKVQSHRLRFKHINDMEDYRLCSRYPAIKEDKKLPKRNRSRLSISVQSEDITSLNPTRITNKEISRRKNISKSEPYVTLVTKQCEQANDLIMGTISHENTKIENFRNIDDNVKNDSDEINSNSNQVKEFLLCPKLNDLSSDNQSYKRYLINECAYFENCSIEILSKIREVEKEIFSRDVNSWSRKFNPESDSNLNPIASCSKKNGFSHIEDLHKHNSLILEPIQTTSDYLLHDKYTQKDNQFTLTSESENKKKGSELDNVKFGFEFAGVNSNFGLFPFSENLVSQSTKIEHVKTDDKEIYSILPNFLRDDAPESSTQWEKANQDFME
ncbi:hypothetical protein EV44_g4567 [Erysiphe necator]|uniref:Uncharacterized protein n=1 Tax=Uncinula necator TaxID=52586 RepID=A0A0B1P527_UNCNE|nr:hypothetical protein EV44_g4567 [Erysiphe necator]